MIDTDKYKDMNGNEIDVDELFAEIKRLREALLTLRNDCQMILDGHDMSGMSDRELFGAMKATILVGLGVD